MLSFRLMVVAACILSAAEARTSAQETMAPRNLSDLSLRMDGPVLRRAVQNGEPFTVAGPQGVLVGQQQGPIEAWILPVKLLSHLTLEAEVQGYAVPLDLNSMARDLEVRPDRTIITYSHIAVTVRQTMFAPEQSPRGTGAVVLFQIDSDRPVTLTVRFTPELREMWPKPGSGMPSAEWVARGSSGFYVLHSDFPRLAGAIALPGAGSGIMAPYQERPQVHPLELILHVDPAMDRQRVYPLLMAVGSSADTATNMALERTLTELDKSLPSIYAEHRAYYEEQQRQATSILTPDKNLNADLFWAETSISQLRARTADGETGLVAGYYASGDSARPGFGWYFGRDTLYTIYALDSYGDFALARAALEFLMRRQRADGKVMHEYSQTARDVDWASLPYEYAAADATPLFLTAVRDYIYSSGDRAFLETHRDAVLNAWRFETTHDADGDGIYDNAQGTGWVESWPAGMPKQEIYLALLDQQASTAMAELATLLGDPSTHTAASARAAKLHATIEAEYYVKAIGTYAFSRDHGGVLDRAVTIFPSVAWWNAGPGLDHAEASLRQWASHIFSTDWGLRDVAENDSMYDPISYHQGSVWPLFTGWAALAQYRAGHSLTGWQALMQNADLTLAQDPGAVTELLSGGFYEPFGRSTSHQLWSSAMVATPLLRGLFGIDVDALHHTVAITPHLPAQWPGAEVRSLHVGGSVVDLKYSRISANMLISLTNVSGEPVHFADGRDSLKVALPAIEIALTHGLPKRGARTSQLKVLAETYTANSLHLEIEGVAGSEQEITICRNGAVAELMVEGAELIGDRLRVPFSSSAYATHAITLRWRSAPSRR